MESRVGAALSALGIAVGLIAFAYPKLLPAQRTALLAVAILCTFIALLLLSGKDESAVRLSWGLYMTSRPTKKSWLEQPESDEDARALEEARQQNRYRYRELAIRTTRRRGIRELRIFCTGPIYEQSVDMREAEEVGGYPFTAASISLANEDVAVVKFAPNPFTRHHQLLVVLGSTEEVRVPRILAVRQWGWSLKRRTAGGGR